MHGRGNERGHLRHVPRNDKRGGRVLGHFAVSLNRLLGDLELNGLLATGFFNGSGNALNGVCGCIGNGSDGCSIALGFIDRGLLFTF